MIPIRCTACGEAAQIDDAWLGQLVECPHCRQPTPAALTPLPLAPPPPPPSSGPVAVADPSPAAAEPEVVRAAKVPRPKAEPANPAPSSPKRGPLTRAERQAIRRHRQMAIAIGGGVILVAALFALLSLRS